MNLIEELNAKRYTVKGLSDEYYTQLLKSIKRYLKKYEGVISQEHFVQFAEDDLRMEHVSFEEFQRLVQLQEEHDRLLKLSPVGKLSDTPGGKEGQKKTDEIRKITNKALIRRLSQEMTYDETKLLPNIPEANLEKANDRVYDYLRELGYRGEKDSGIPRVVTGNYQMFCEKELINEEIFTLVEANCRMQYYLKKYKENPRLYKSPEALKIAFQDKPIRTIRRELGLPDSPKTNLEKEKVEKMERFHLDSFQMYQTFGMDVENRANAIANKMINDVIETDETAYEQLREYGYDAKKETSPIIRSGSMLYADLTVCRDLKKDVFNSCLALYSQVTQIDSAREYLEAEDAKVIQNPVREVYNEVIRKPMAEKRYRKGKATQEEVEAAIQAVKADKMAHRLRLPSVLRKNVRDIDTLER